MAKNSKRVTRARIRSPLADYPSAPIVSTFVYLHANLTSLAESHRQFIDFRT